MVAVDSTASPVRLKRIGRGWRRRQEKRRRLRRKSTKLVKTGQVDLAPCVVCGSEVDVEIHHIEPIQPDRFVFLCRPCHVLAHRPVFRTMQVCIAPGHFSIRPDAILPKDAALSQDAVLSQKEVTRG